MSEDADKLRRVFAAAVAAVDPRRLVREFLAGSRLRDEPKVMVVGGGKAGGPMAQGVETVLGSRASGWVNVPADAMVPTSHIRLHPARPAGFNLPTQDGVVGADAILDCVGLATEPIIALISGGGSALIPAPVAGVDLADKLESTRRLQAAGASIGEVNAVRKHLSRLKGGGLSRAAKRCPMLSLVISDVMHDPLDVIASGPTVPDPTTFAEAVSVCDRYAVALPRSARDHLERGIRGETPETLKAPVSGHDTVILANNRTARLAACDAASRFGWNVRHLDQDQGGAHRELADAMVQEIRSTLKRPTLIVSGGETTVRLCERPGRGGRNQELGLEIWMRLSPGERRHVLILTAGTDGEDGPTDAAGCLIPADARDGDEDAIRHALAANDAYPLLLRWGWLFKSGPTGTNVMDLRLILVA